MYFILSLYSIVHNLFTIVIASNKIWYIWNQSNLWFALLENYLSYDKLYNLLTTNRIVCEFCMLIEDFVIIVVNVYNYTTKCV